MTAGSGRTGRIDQVDDNVGDEGPETVRG